MAKVTVFECYGTFDTTGTTSMVKGSLDPDLFTYIPVTNYPNSLDNFGNSVAQGVAAVQARIAATPGKIVLTGVSQGAQIMATVYQALRNGPRAADIVGVYLVGNPLRQAGRAFPGANPVPAGHGVAPASYRLTDTPDLVWEFANPGDPVCTIGDDAAGTALQAAFGQVLQGVRPASNDLATNIVSMLGFATQIGLRTGGQGVIPGLSFKFPGISVPFFGQVYVIPGIFNAFTQAGNFGVNHQYFEAYKPIAGDPRSGRQIIVDHLNTVIAPLHASAPVPSTPRLYGLVAANGTPRPAAEVVRRWNDKRVRHTVYTVCGTTTDGWGLTNVPTPEEAASLLTLARQVTGNPALTLADLPPNGTPSPDYGVSCDTAVGRAANPDLFNWVPISYPASSPVTGGNIETNWIPAKNTMANSARIGTEEVVRQIKATPGTFALVGMSQGAVVISQVLKAMLPGGVLADRYKDCIAGIAFGNPCRAPGTGLPGVAAAPGGGVISLNYPQNPYASGLTPVKNQIPSWWWEFALPGDFFASAPVDGVAGPIFTPAIQATFHLEGSLNYNHNVFSYTLALIGLAGATVELATKSLLAQNLYGAAQIVNFFGNPQTKAWLSAAAQQNPTAFLAFTEFIRQQLGTFQRVPISLANPFGLIFVPSNFYPTGNPHIRYGSDKPPSLPTGLAGVNSNSTYVDIGIAYLNARGAAVAPR
jgi:hypothetical protein